MHVPGGGSRSEISPKADCQSTAATNKVAIIVCRKTRQQEKGMCVFLNRQTLQGQKSTGQERPNLISVHDNAYADVTFSLHRPVVRSVPHVNSKG